jgi:poly(3-hydroxybutyrate) depolymerase
MGGPIDARKSPTAVNNLAMNKSFEWFENNVIYRVPQGFPGEGRRVYPGFLQHTGFVAMNPDRHASSHYDYFKDLIKGDDASAEAHRKFYDEYNAVLDMDADYYLETIKTVFQEFDLVNGTWDVKNPEGQLERVRPQDIRTTALLTVEGELDDISGSGQTQAAHELCTQIRGGEHYEVKGAGHYGIFSGRRWRDLVYPRVRAFIAAHDEPQVRTRRVATSPHLTSEDTIKAAPAPSRAPAVARKAVPASAPAASPAPARKAASSRKLAPTASRKASATSRKPRA